MAKKHMERWLTSLINQKYPEISPHFSPNGYCQKNPQTINAGEGVERREPFYTVGRNVCWYSHYGEQYGSSLKTRATVWPCSPTPEQCLEKNMVWKDTGAPVFTAALFTVAKAWKQPECPSTEEWIKKTWYMHTMGYYSVIKKSGIMPFAVTWMDLESVTEWSQKSSNMTSLLCKI